MSHPLPKPAGDGTSRKIKPFPMSRSNESPVEISPERMTSGLPAVAAGGDWEAPRCAVAELALKISAQINPAMNVRIGMKLTARRKPCSQRRAAERIRSGCAVGDEP